ncbi:Kelch repeat-containing protein [Hoeflea poritis]|uniref:Kelch repeat protein n=1 Tax=Hoeflea poritis TaxID=2993659 RepID=A0ABT4VS57_9HYPH|nr:hypothetical protein [Hoeflea poritis]MDA4847547.1 hypothetical protein [Hoeflea poritis]
MLRTIKKLGKQVVPGPVQRIVKDREDLAFRDLFPRKPGDFEWRLGPRSPVACVEASREQIGHRLFVFGGYIQLNRVSNQFLVLDLEQETWTGRGRMPDDMAQTHVGSTNDGKRFVFLISGQLGINCSPVTTSCYSFDTETQTFAALPPLPEGRYQPLVHYLDGRIHCLSGVGPDRNTTMNDHWSIGVDGGRATEETWRSEPPLPSGRIHSANFLHGSGLYVLAGQQGDVPRVAGSADFVCNFDTPLDHMMDECYRFDLKTAEFRLLEPAPEKISHTEHAVVSVGSHVILAGGIYDRLTMGDHVLSFDLDTEKWRKIGHLPYPMKAKLAAYHDGRFYILTGQRCFSATDLRAGRVLDTVWKSDTLPALLRQ